MISGNNIMNDFDVCIIGSGAGGSPIAKQVSIAGYSVVVVEKGPFFTEKDFFKDEIGECRRNKYTPKLSEEPHMVETYDDETNSWENTSTLEANYDFWNGCMVGGSSNLMSGFFHRMKPFDFKLKTTFGDIEGANIADWPISYEDLEPYYTLAETEVGISGVVVDHPFADKRSTPNFPYEPLREHPLSNWIDKAGHELGLNPFPIPRAILSKPTETRSSCSYTGFCGSYACNTKAKGSARVAFLEPAIKTNRCTIIANAKVFKIVTNESGKITNIKYFDNNNKIQSLNAKYYVVACQSIETSRLLLLSKGSKYPNGLSNNNGLVGKNLLFTATGSGWGDFNYHKIDSKKVKELSSLEPFINRAFQDFYVYSDPETKKNRKGGTIDFLFDHPNPISSAISTSFNTKDYILWGRELKNELEHYFKHSRHIIFEVFCDWMPTNDTNVSLDLEKKDKWDIPVAKVKLGNNLDTKANLHTKETVEYVASQGYKILEKLGTENSGYYAGAHPSTNLVAGGCRFGLDPKTSVLNIFCQSHEVENLFIADGSFMPTGGSVPYTWTIYANSLRIADHIVKRLGGIKDKK